MFGCSVSETIDAQDFVFYILNNRKSVHSIYIYFLHCYSYYHPTFLNQKRSVMSLALI